MRVDAFNLHNFRTRFPYGSSHAFFATYFASEMSCSLGRYEISFWDVMVFGPWWDLKRFSYECSCILPHPNELSKLDFMLFSCIGFWWERLPYQFSHALQLHNYIVKCDIYAFGLWRDFHKWDFMLFEPSEMSRDLLVCVISWFRDRYEMSLWDLLLFAA